MTNLAVSWECDVEVADCVVVKCAIRASFLHERQTAAGLLGCIPNLQINYTIIESYRDHKKVKIKKYRLCI